MKKTKKRKSFVFDENKREFTPNDIQNIWKYKMKMIDLPR